MADFMRRRAALRRREVPVEELQPDMVVVTYDPDLHARVLAADGIYRGAEDEAQGLEDLRALGKVELLGPLTARAIR
jgi:hypothetical protein